MELLYDLAQNFLTLLNAFSVYIVIGLFIAGILKQIIPNDFVSSHLGKDSTGSVIKATLFGIPLPVCSCSVIPLAQALRKEGASKGSVQSFMISTPITGVDSILATFSLFGFVFTAFRLISSIIIAIVVGLMQNLFEKRDNQNKSNQNINFKSFSTVKPTVENISCCGTTDKKGFSIKSIFTYAYGTLFSDMAKALLIGLILGSLFITFMPQEYSAILFENRFLTYIVIMLIAIPLYTCATSSLPIAAAFMLQGMSGGAAFIFLTAGPATSAVTMSIIYKLLGKKSLIIYVSTISSLALLFGIGFDMFFEELEILKVSLEDKSSSLIEGLASLAVLLLIFYHIFKSKFAKKEQEKSSCCS